MRVGIGYDIHSFQEGRVLVIGGVTFPGETGLAGHSDADVLLHAIIDAVLGAAGLGDIGSHFPSDDPTYSGADSCQLLAKACQFAQKAGYRIGNVDATVIAERPHLAPAIESMRTRTAAAMDCELMAVNVKATTSEGIGVIGSGEGIAAMAVVLLVKE